ncbi:DUF488 domain-containing protein [Nocardioides jensenii]|uniref:DUF488 domain-containing protein n=1 Tax=Nocardioides jensenii TaxID=1843 RepID=UPI001C3F49BA|nr:DUF488 domain-containing protein [Nocardioides jensenii]
MSAPNAICTIGHSNRDFDDVLAMLRANAITDLVDIRSFPSSRTFPQWNQDRIIDVLPTDIDYHWIRNLGGRRHTPKDVPSPNTGWNVKAFRDYADYTATPEFGQGLAELIELARQGRPAIMCSEAVPWRCHRRLVTDALLVAGIDVEHIMSLTLTTPATLTGHAHLDDGHLTYPPAGE